MKILADYHTHTIYSHGKGDIIDNAKQAKALGIKTIAITDHGFGHKLYGVNKKLLKEIRYKIDFAKIETGVNILLGIEANFTSVTGELDITKEDLNQFDILIAGHHRFVKSKLKDKFKLFLPNMLGIKSQKQIKINTNTILQAMDKYPIKILAHLNHHMPVDIKLIAESAVKKGIWIEINAPKNHFTDEDILLMASMGVKFVVNSDAHKPQNVGNILTAVNRLIKLGVGLKQIVNVEEK